MDEMKALAVFGRDMNQEPPATLLRQRSRLLDALADGRAVRRRPRRRLLFAGTAAVLVAGAALALVLPARHGGSAAAPTGVALAGWSVKAEADGDVQVTLRELTDATAVRQALASAKVPARVWLVPVKAADPTTFGALAAPIVGCTPDYLRMKRIEGQTGVDGVEYPVANAQGIVFQVKPSAMPANTIVNIVLYTLEGKESGYYIAVTKSADNACTPYEK